MNLLIKMKKMINIQLINFVKLIKSIVIFTNEQKCLEFINKFRSKNKLFLIVSGSLGKNFVPKIYHLSQINSIYIFCGQLNES